MRTAPCLLILLLLAAPSFAKQIQPPKLYDEPALKADCEKYLQSLDPAAFAKDYPRILKDLLSLDLKLQAETLHKTAALHDLNALPFLIPFLQSSDTYVRVYAGLAIESTIAFHCLKRRDPAVGETVVLKPLGKDDPDLRPLGWVVLQMLRTDDPNLQGYAATMTRYLELRQFAAELQHLTTSRHPAAVNAAIEALKSLDLPTKPQQ